MSSHLLRPGIVTLTALALAACGSDTTEPTLPATRVPSAPEAAVTSNAWVYRADMPGVARWKFATATVKNTAGQSVLYAIGGSTAVLGGASRNSVQAYNAATNTWLGRSPLPQLRSSPNGAGVIDGKIYVSGGRVRQVDWNNLYVYNPATNTWREKAGMPVSGSGGVTDVLSRRLYVYTECDRCDPAGPRFFRYNPDTDRWTVLAPPKGSHDFGVGGFIGGKFYLVGGFATTDLEVYDPATNQWTTVGSIPRLRQLAAGAVLGGQLYMIGGMEHVNPDSVAVITRVNAYDPITNKWRLKAPLPTPRDGIVAGRVSAVPGGPTRIEVVGGYEPGNNLQYIP
jgi:hypothetical protein